MSMAAFVIELTIKYTLYLSISIHSENMRARMALHLLLFLLIMIVFVNSFVALVERVRLYFNIFFYIDCRFFCILFFF